MKSVMISIQPKWIEKIANGEKTIEVRKTRPKIETPFKVYMYCTNGSMLRDFRNEKNFDLKNKFVLHSEKSNNVLASSIPFLNRKVVAEFTCTKIHKVDNNGSQFSINNDIALTNMIGARSRLDFYDMKRYLGTKDGYAWEIESLKIYDKPKELEEFKNLKGEPIKNAYQSWGYINE